MRLMEMLALLVVALTVSVQASDFPSLDTLQPQLNGATQEEAVRGLMTRLIGHRSAEFEVHIQPGSPGEKDFFKIQSQSKTIVITATTGVTAAWGFYYYLSHFCNLHVSWAGTQLNLPSSLPPIPSPGVTINANDRFRYYQNVCTVSYSFVWWDWNRWEREIDWMAMHSINLPLAFNAQEAIWQRVYLKMGFTQQELDVHFGGPAFLAWSRMGNMRGWGGPLSANWHSQQILLQHRILKRMRELGMIPVLPAFAGHVPAAIKRLYPNVKVSRLGDWGHFNTTYCCTSLLDVEEPLFQQIGKSFITEYIKEFGTDHIYNTDTFNEMTPSSSDPSYLSKAGQAVFNGIKAGDSQAVWLMQGWLFLSNFWKPPQAKALLTSVPRGRMLVLDLYSEVSPQYPRLESYYGQPFIWCMLHNFGGTLPMYGAIESVNNGPFQGRSFPNSTMVGIGITPEGINQNNVMYEFMLENSWRKQPADLTDWMNKYALRRYGSDSEAAKSAWQNFKKTVYNCTDGQKHHHKNVLVRRPGRKSKIDRGVYNCTSHYSDHGSDAVFIDRPSLDLHPQVWYSPEEFFQGWDLMIEASQTLNNSLFRYDLVDVTRQSLQILFITYYNDILTHFKAKNITGVQSTGKGLLDLLSDLDRLLTTDEHFLLGKWISSARALGVNDLEKNQYEYNARNQITLWGPDGNILDYANKQWGGLIQGYYSPRWELFVTALLNSLQMGIQFNEAQFKKDVFEKVERPFTFQTNTYPDKPFGDQIELCCAVHSKYRPVTKAHAAFMSILPKLSRTGKKFTKYSTKWAKQFYRKSYASTQGKLKMNLDNWNKFPNNL